MLKKNSIQLEKDAINENIFYISFNYMSLSNFNIKIFFNACENTPENLIKQDSCKKSNTKSEKEIDDLKEDLKSKENNLIDINIDESQSNKDFK